MCEINKILQTAGEIISLSSSKTPAPPPPLVIECWPPYKLGSRSHVTRSGIQRDKCFFPAHSQRCINVRSLTDQEVTFSASDRQGSNFEFYVLRVVPSRHPQEVLLAQSYLLSGRLNSTIGLCVIMISGQMVCDTQYK